MTLANYDAFEGFAAAPVQRGGLPPELVTRGVFFVSVTAMLLGNFAGTIGAVVFLGLWVLLGIVYGKGCAGLLASGPRWLWALPSYLVCSTLWSQFPSETLKFAMEFAATAGCAVLAASLMRPRVLVAVLTACLISTAVLSVIAGKQLVDPLTGAVAFVGVFESKNQLAFFTSLMLLAGMALSLDRGQMSVIRLMGFVAIVAALPLLVLTRSGTAVLTAGFSTFFLLGNLVMSRMSRFGRARVLFAVAVILMPAGLLLAIGGDQIASGVLGALGKDATLTGRTVLWQHALELIPQHRLLGQGYQAFWHQDTVEAESLWHEFHVLSRQGFHFHSTYVESAIELGYLGAGVVVATLLGVFGGLVRWSWASGSVIASFFTALMFCMLTRSFVEVDVLFQFQIGSFVLFLAGTYAVARPTGEMT